MIGHRQLADLLARPDAVPGRGGRQERGDERRLAGTGLARDRDPAPELHQHAEERGGFSRQRVALDQVVEGHVAHHVPPQGRRQLVADRRDRRGEARGAPEHAGLDHRMLGVELAIGHREHALDDLPVLLLAGGHGEPPQAPGSVEVRHPCTLDEDLLDITPGDQLRQGTEVRNGAQHPLGHLGRLDERELLTEQRDALIRVDRPTDLGPDLVEVRLRAEPAALDPRVDVAPDDVVGVGAHAFLLRFGVAARSDVSSCASDATAARNGPRPTSSPSHAAASTRASVGSQVIDCGRSVRTISARISSRR